MADIVKRPKESSWYNLLDQVYSCLTNYGSDNYQLNYFLSKDIERAKYPEGTVEFELDTVVPGYSSIVIDKQKDNWEKAKNIINLFNKVAEENDWPYIIKSHEKNDKFYVDVPEDAPVQWRLVNPTERLRAMEDDMVDQSVIDLMFSTDWNDLVDELNSLEDKEEIKDVATKRIIELLDREFPKLKKDQKAKGVQDGLDTVLGLIDIDINESCKVNEEKNENMVEVVNIEDLFKILKDQEDEKFEEPAEEICPDCEEAETEEVFPNPEKHELVTNINGVDIYFCKDCRNFAAMINGEKVKKESFVEIKACAEGNCEPKAEVEVSVETPSEVVTEECGIEEEINESVETSMPVRPLPVDQVKEFIMSLPEPDPHTPPRFFKLGYIKELGQEIPSKFRGGRGSEGEPFVRIFKCTEYSALYTGSDWRGTNATKAADKILGTERHTGEKTGFSHNEDSVNRIGTYRDGSEALQAYIADHSKQRVKFFISLDDEDLHEASREEVAQYLTPASAARILNPGSSRVAAGQDEAGNDVFDKPINRFKLTNIYMIGNLGSSII